MRWRTPWVLMASACWWAGAIGMLAVPAAHAGPALDPKIEALVTQTCAGCHGPDGNSPLANVPKLAGQHKVYLLSEMRNYREQKRHSDVMFAIISALGDDEMASLAEYYAAQTPTPGTVTRPNLLALGKRIYLEGNTNSGVPSCDGCHEENGEGSKKYPRVAGQHVTYLLEEIARYAEGKRNGGAKVMRTVAARLTKEEAEAVAEYMASLK